MLTSCRLHITISVHLPSHQAMVVGGRVQAARGSGPSIAYSEPPEMMLVSPSCLREVPVLFISEPPDPARGFPAILPYRASNGFSSGQVVFFFLSPQKSPRAAAVSQRRPRRTTRRNTGAATPSAGCENERAKGNTR